MFISAITLMASGVEEARRRQEPLPSRYVGRAQFWGQRTGAELRWVDPIFGCLRQIHNCLGEGRRWRPNRGTVRAFRPLQVHTVLKGGVRSGVQWLRRQNHKNLERV